MLLFALFCPLRCFFLFTQLHLPRRHHHHHQLLFNAITMRLSYYFLFFCLRSRLSPLIDLYFYFYNFFSSLPSFERELKTTIVMSTDQQNNTHTVEGPFSIGIQIYIYKLTKEHISKGKQKK